MSDTVLLAVAYVGILGAWAAYAGWLVVRVARARREQTADDSPRPEDPAS